MYCNTFASFCIIVLNVLTCLQAAMLKEVLKKSGIHSLLLKYFKVLDTGRTRLIRTRLIQSST